VIEPSRSFDRAAVEYERARPGYPSGVLDVLPLGADIVALDLGAGTGKLTRVLAGRYRRVIAVEPLDGMRGILEEVVPAAESLAGSAEAIPLADTSVDAVFAAQAFHWFANDEAVTEIARVLRPGGILCSIWNESVDPSPLPEPYRAYLRTLYLPKTDVVGHPWADVVARGPFGEIHEAAARHEQVQDRDDVLAFAQSVSWIAHRPREERERIMGDLDELLPPGPFTFAISAGVNWVVRT
jgi:SAM-dependent methyltransferase